jgi:hypothetical protein
MRYPDALNHSIERKDQDTVEESMSRDQIWVPYGTGLEERGGEGRELILCLLKLSTRMLRLELVMP